MGVLGAIERLSGARADRGGAIDAEIHHLAVDLRVVQNPRDDDEQQGNQKGFQTLEHAESLCESFGRTKNAYRERWEVRIDVTNHRRPAHRSQTRGITTAKIASHRFPHCLTVAVRYSDLVWPHAGKRYRPGGYIYAGR